jgi:hypothetical protein
VLQPPPPLSFSLLLSPSLSFSLLLSQSVRTLSHAFAESTESKRQKTRPLPLFGLFFRLSLFLSLSLRRRLFGLGWPSPAITLNHHSHHHHHHHNSTIATQLAHCSPLTRNFVSTAVVSATIVSIRISLVTLSEQPEERSAIDTADRRLTRKGLELRYCCSLAPIRLLSFVSLSLQPEETVEPLSRSTVSRSHQQVGCSLSLSLSLFTCTSSSLTTSNQHATMSTSTACTMRLWLLLICCTALAAASSSAPHLHTLRPPSATNPAHFLRESADTSTGERPSHCQSAGASDNCHFRPAAPSPRRVDQADRDRLLKQLESRLLEMFGLSNRPRPTRPITIPPYMIELYLLQQRDNQPDDDEEDDVNVDGVPNQPTDQFAYEHVTDNVSSGSSTGSARHKHARTRPASDDESDQSRIPMLGWANTIRSHPLARSIVQPSPSSQVLLQFNVSLPSDERLVAAELRLFVNGCNSSTSSSSSSPSSSTSTSSACAPSPTTDRWYRISVDDVIPFGGRPLTDNEFGQRQIDVQTVHLQPDHWLQFDVLPAVQRWLQSKPGSPPSIVSSSSTNALLVRSQLIESSVSNLAPSPSLLLSPDVKTDDSFWEIYKPILLTYR